MVQNPLNQNDIDNVVNLAQQLNPNVPAAYAASFEYNSNELKDHINALYKSSRKKTGTLPDVENFLKIGNPNFRDFQELFNNLHDAKNTLVENNKLHALDGIKTMLSWLISYLESQDILAINDSVNTILPNLGTLINTVKANAVVTNELAGDVGQANFWETKPGHRYTHEFYKCSAQGTGATSIVKIYDVTNHPSLTDIENAKSLCVVFLGGSGGGDPLTTTDSYISFDGVTCSNAISSAASYAKCLAGVNFDQGLI